MNSEQHCLQCSLFTDRILELTILPTEQCNFRCVYCYETFHRGRMHERVISGIKHLIDSRVATLDHLRIGWFGGEPLLARSIVLDISSYASALAQRLPQLHYDSGMSTNGYLLTADVVEELVAVGVTDFQVSLDGPESYHDRLRRRRDGGPTFAQIWKNLLSLRDSTVAFRVNLRVHISKRNLPLMEDFVVTIGAGFGDDSRFRIFFKPLARLGSIHDDSQSYFEESEARAVKARLERRLPSELKAVLQNASRYVCYAGRPTSFVVRSDGQIVKCTVGLDDPENEIGFIAEDGTLKIDQSRIRKWLEGAVRLDEEKLRCPRSFLGSPGSRRPSRCEE